jgi:hypothetical protein
MCQNVACCTHIDQRVINKRLTVNIFQSENELLLETTLTVNKIKIKFHYKQNEGICTHTYGICHTCRFNQVFNLIVCNSNIMFVCV